MKYVTKRHTDTPDFDNPPQKANTDSQQARDSMRRYVVRNHARLVSDKPYGVGKQRS